MEGEGDKIKSKQASKRDRTLLALLLDDITTIKPCNHAKKANLLLDDRGWCNNMKMAFSLATIYLVKPKR